MNDDKLPTPYHYEVCFTTNTTTNTRSIFI